MPLCSRKLTLLIFIAICCASIAQAPAPVQRPTSTPYTGDLSRFDNAGRAERLQINDVMDALGIVPGKSVADIGAGSGFFTVPSARRVGDKGTVYEAHLNPAGIQY